MKITQVHHFHPVIENHGGPVGSGPTNYKDIIIKIQVNLVGVGREITTRHFITWRYQ